MENYLNMSKSVTRVLESSIERGELFIGSRSFAESKKCLEIFRIEYILTVGSNMNIHFDPSINVLQINIKDNENE